MTENVVWHSSSLATEQRWELLGVRGAVVWLTGFSGSGKSTIAVELERQLVGRRQPVVLLDGDNLRHGLNADLGFSEADRTENIRRVAEVAALVAEAGMVAVVPLISPYRSSRDAARSVIESKGIRFVEVFVDTSLEECERRDPKGLYAKARSGELPGFTGIDDPYEPPLHPEVRIVAVAGGSPAEAAGTIRATLEQS